VLSAALSDAHSGSKTIVAACASSGCSGIGVGGIARVMTVPSGVLCTRVSANPALAKCSSTTSSCLPRARHDSKHGAPSAAIVAARCL
jgi:hypothetical protein